LEYPELSEEYSKRVSHLSKEMWLYGFMKLLMGANASPVANTYGMFLMRVSDELAPEFPNYYFQTTARNPCPA
jgi:hypothetical protein